MAVQSLYRRYRPRRFSEVKGQEHVVRALRNAVINHREGQAYLFSGPRGTGKTTSARILAKVLNCESSVDGEPCCECASCLAVEAGTSYDVHELDAASNNGVDAMRDLIDKAMLGTPGRHKVYILDEVHMLSKAAEAALLKTLEEPPPHVVFVLATTDPQKVSETIRSRTQHLQFHLLQMDVMEDHIRWLAADAGLDVTDGAVQAVLRRGGGSARDTISALELVAAGGGDAEDETPLDEFVEALIETDPGRALAAVASVMRQGRDARTLTESLIAHLRDCFLSLMAPELVQLPDQRAAEVSTLAQRLGAAPNVRAMEVLGSMLVEMRHAPDPRVLLEVALVKLTSASADPGFGALAARLDRLEQAVARGLPAAPPGGAVPAGVAPAAGTPGGARGATARPSDAVGGGETRGAPPAHADPESGAAARPGGLATAGTGAPGTSPRQDAPRDPATGRAVLGGRIRRDGPLPPTSRPSPDSLVGDKGRPTLPGEGASAEPNADRPGSPQPSEPGDGRSGAETASAAWGGTASSTAGGAAVYSDASSDQRPRTIGGAPTEHAGPSRPAAGDDPSGSEPLPAESPLAPVTPLRPAADSHIGSDQLAAARSALVAGLRPLAKAVLAAGTFVREHHGTIELAVPSDPLKRRAEDQRVDIERGLSDHFHRPIRLSVIVDPSARHHDDGPMPPMASAPTQAEEDEIDLSELVDAPAVPVVDNIDRIAAAFPGSQLIDDVD